MNSDAAERVHVAAHLLDKDKGRSAPGRGTPLGRKLRQNRKESGKGVRQAVVGHELTWRPSLSGIGYGQLRVEPPADTRAPGSLRAHRTYLYNVGGSPAICARYVHRRESTGWLLSTPVDVPVRGVEIEVMRGERLDENVARTLLGSIGVAEELAGAIFCRDFLERRWCFPISAAERGAILEPIVWRKSTRAPGWAASPALWSPQPA